MSRDEIPLSESRTRRNSSRSTRYTDAEFIIVDITYPVRSFVSSIDPIVDDLGYDIEAILLKHARYGRRHAKETDLKDLANELYAERHVKNKDDAYLISERALYQLFPEISEMLRVLGYVVSGMHQVKLTKTIPGQLHCRALLAAL